MTRLTGKAITMILSVQNTLTEDIQLARKNGFTEDFYHRDGFLIGRNNGKSYSKTDCELIEYCRHEGLTDPSDASILFLIECRDGTKGCLSSAYGAYADTEVIEFVLAIKKKEKVL